MKKRNFLGFESHPELEQELSIFRGMNVFIVLAEGFSKEGYKITDYRGFDKAAELLEQEDLPVIVYSSMPENYFFMDTNPNGIGDKLRLLLKNERFGFISGHLPHKEILKKMV